MKIAKVTIFLALLILIAGCVKKEIAYVIDEEIYTVKEVKEKFAADKEYFKNRQIKVKACFYDKLLGLGCEGVSTFIDQESLDLVPYRFDFSRFPIDESKAKEYDIKLEAIKSVPRLSANVVGVSKDIFPTGCGIYLGHFFDGGYMKQCQSDGSTFIIDQKLSELGIEESLRLSQTINSGAVIFNGRYIAKPYTIQVNDYRLTINNELYFPASQEEAEKVTMYTNDRLQQEYDLLAKDLNEGQCIIYGKYRIATPQCSEDSVEIINSIINSEKGKKEKGQEIAEHFNTSPDNEFVRDVLENWSN